MTRLGLAVGLCALVLAACGGGSQTPSDDGQTPDSGQTGDTGAGDGSPAGDETEASGETSLVKIGAIQEDRPQASPWAAALHDSLVALEAEDGNIEFTETYDAFDPTKAEPQIRQFIEDDYRLILAHSFALSDVVHELAEEYPDVLFEVSNFEDPVPPNLTVATESYLQVGYATCWLLASLSESGTIGMVGAEPIPYQQDIETGCNLGASAANPDVNVLVAWSGSFTDLQKSREQAESLVNQGADGIFAATATQDSLGVLVFCEENPDLNCSGWSADSRQYAPNTAVTSIIIDWAVPLRDWVEQVRTDEFDVKVNNLTFENDGLTTQPFEGPAAEKVPADVQSEFLDVVDSLAAGEIELPESVAHPCCP